MATYWGETLQEWWCQCTHMLRKSASNFGTRTYFLHSHTGRGSDSFLHQVMPHLHEISQLYVNESLNRRNLDAIVRNLLSPFSIRRLCLFRTEIGPSGAAKLAEGIRWTRSLRTVLLQGNNMGDCGVSSVMHALQFNTSIWAFTMSWERMNDETIASIGELVRVSQSLRILHLQDTHISPKGVFFIAKGLMENCHLISLDLRFSKFGSLGAQYLGEALKVNKTLKHLCLLGIASFHIVYSVMSCLMQTLQ
eukprot:TRINITY_DN648_c0_g1_i8.p1 TRINITY_DN648_c0_g1~~TRINITY_DN648_c0_g1_i8.p1  ORF type:complete len:265 (-),score=31.63 TRINITY_DN648_c0_g1_i8:247-996(-)